MNSLTIRISSERIIFTTYERLRNTLPDYDTYINNPDISLNANIHAAIKSVAIAKGDYNVVNIYTDEATTLVPLNEFEEDDAEDIYFFNFPSTRQRHKVFYDTLPYLNALLLFSVDKDVCRSLRDFYPNAKFHSTLTALVMQFVARYPFSSTIPRMYCYICENRLWLVVVKAGKLEFMNSYMLHNLSDALYYVASIAQRLQIKPDEEKIYVSGNEKDATELTASLSKINLTGFLMTDNEELSQHPISQINDFPYDLKVVLLKAY